MKSIAVAAIAFVVGTGPAWAESQSGMSQQTPAQQQQQQQQQQAQSKPLSQARIEGKVQKVSQDQITLSVAGTDVKLSAEKQDLQGVKEGDNVQVTAVPLPEVKQVTSMQQASPDQRQKAREADKKTVMGSIEDIQEDVITVKTNTMGSQRVKVEQKQAQSLQTGQQYIFQLSSAPDEAKEWKALKIQRM